MYIKVHNIFNSVLNFHPHLFVTYSLFNDDNNRLNQNVLNLIDCVTFQIEGRTGQIEITLNC